MMLLLEHWKPVLGLETRYEVSNVGNICGLRSSGPFKAFSHLSVNTHKQWGRRYVNTFDGNKRRIRKLHQLVAEAFFGKTPVGMTVNHIDGVKTRDRVSNLEFLTLIENIKHAQRMGLLARGERSGTAKLTEKDIVRIRILAATVTKAELGRRHNVSEATIRKIITRETWNHIP